MPRLVAWSALRVGAQGLLAAAILLVTGGHVGAFLVDVREIGLVDRLRATCTGPGAPSPVAVACLVLLSAAAVGAQYVLRWPVSPRRIGRTMELIPRWNGRAELGVGVLDACLVGASEELIFRVGLPGALHVAGAGLWWCLGVPLVVFAVVHRKPLAVGNALALGSAATVVYVATADVRWAIALHAGANLLARGVAAEICRARATRIARAAIRSVGVGSPSVR